MQFIERSKKTFPKLPEVFRLKSEKYERIFSFLKPCFCQKVLSGSLNANLATIPQVFQQKSKAF